MPAPLEARLGQPACTENPQIKARWQSQQNQEPRMHDGMVGKPKHHYLRTLCICMIADRVPCLSILVWAAIETGVFSARAVYYRLFKILHRLLILDGEIEQRPTPRTLISA